MPGFEALKTCTEQGKFQGQNTSMSEAKFTPTSTCLTNLTSASYMMIYRGLSSLSTFVKWYGLLSAENKHIMSKSNNNFMQMLTLSCWERAAPLLIRKECQTLPLQVEEQLSWLLHHQTLTLPSAAPNPSVEVNLHVYKGRWHTVCHKYTTLQQHWC